VMIGHLYHPAFSGQKRLPATLSPQAVDGWVRGKLGFSGVIVTDDMEMGAIRRYHKINAAAVMAVNSGNDIILYSNAGRDPQFADRLIAAIRTAVEKGEIPRQRIEDSYRRIMRLKGQMQVASVDPATVETVGSLPLPAPAAAPAAVNAHPAPVTVHRQPEPEPEPRPGFFRRLIDRF
ncbi:MAG: glycoside hydrolase family 3 N-terminal domain-containing protein, partial [Hyphomicrobiales bacterium]